MFRLYYILNQSVQSLIFQNEELTPCLQYVLSRHFIPSKCAIISPNNRRITFDANNSIVFGEPVR